MPLVIIAGEPGETWTNNTEKALWQLQCNWKNSCGQCGQFDGQLARYWPIPIHYGCRCKQTVVLPGKESLPFTDFRETIRNLSDEQQTRVVGRANLQLIESGVVEWGDVVTKGRIRTLAEVASRNKLTVGDFTKAGISQGKAQRTLAQIHTPEEELAKRSARVLADLLKAQGYTTQQITEEAGRMVANRVVMKGAPVRGGEKRAAIPFGGRAAKIAAIRVAALKQTPEERSAAKEPVEVFFKDEPKPFGPSDAPVVHQTRKEDTDSLSRDFFGRELSDKEYATLAGATSDSEVMVRRTGNNITIETVGPKYEATREIVKKPDGIKIKNVSFEVNRDAQGSGIGVEVFGRQVEEAIKLGVKEITCFATGGSGMVGYKVWPKFGYDGKIELFQQEQLPPTLKGAQKISDLYATPEGRDWWEKNGKSIPMTFDLTEGSYSRTTWDAYLKAKTEAKKKP